MRFFVFFLFLSFSTNFNAQSYDYQEISSQVDDVLDYFHSSSDKLFYANSSNLWIYDLRGDSLYLHANWNLSSEVTAIIACEKREEVFIGTKDGSIARFDFINKNMTHFVTHPEDRITSMAFDTQDENLLAGGINGIVYKHNLLDIVQNDVLTICKGQIAKIEPSFNGKYLAVCDESGFISLFDGSTLYLIASIKISDNYLRDISFVPEKDIVVAVDDKGWVYRWRISESGRISSLGQSRKALTKILCIEVSQQGDSFCYGGINHKLYVETPFGNYSRSFSGPVLKSSFFEREGYIYFVNCLYGQGIVLTSLASM